MLPVNPFSRPGKLRTDTLGIVWHWTSVPMQDAEAVERYFASLATQSPTDNVPDDYRSSHAVIGLDGTVRQLIPWDEVAYHAGAVSYRLPWMELYPQYSHNVVGKTPNYALIGIELCHPTADGHFTQQTLAAALGLGCTLLNQYTLGYPDIYRHYDITGKICPKYWVQKEDAWHRFTMQIKGALELRR